MAVKLNEWRKPTPDIVDHQYMVIIYEYLDQEFGEKETDLDIFTYDGIKGFFISTNRNKSIKFKEIKLWVPIPEIPKNLRS